MEWNFKYGFLTFPILKKNHLHFKIKDFINSLIQNSIDWIARHQFLQCSLIFIIEHFIDSFIHFLRVKFVFSM